MCLSDIREEFNITSSIVLVVVTPVQHGYTYILNGNINDEGCVDYIDTRVSNFIDMFCAMNQRTDSRLLSRGASYVASKACTEFIYNNNLKEVIEYYYDSLEEDIIWYIDMYFYDDEGT